MAAKTITCIPGAGVANLKNYTGKSVEDFCPFGYGKVKDSENHCAHFVSHALNIQVGTVCSDLLPWNKSAPDARWGVRTNEKAGMVGFRGATTRVNDVYNSLPAANKGDWDTRPDPAADCLMYATVIDNVNADRSTMMTQSKKHVGIHSGGNVWNYGNTGDKVVCDTVEQFKAKLKSHYGPKVIFLWSSIPDVGTACVHAG